MMNDKAKQITRKSSTPIKVYCLPEEKEHIEAQAKRAGMSAARYLREVGQGYKIKGGSIVSRSGSWLESTAILAVWVTS